MSQLKHILVLALADWLEQKLITEVSGDTQAKLVKPYRFQSNPLVENIYVWVSSGDIQNPNDPDARINSTGMEDLGLKVPSGEVGGGHLWWRRGKAEIGCYFIKTNYDEVQAADIAHTVYGRTMHWLERAPVAGLVDDFGELAYQVFVYASTLFEGGGPPTQYYWRGNVSWQCLTERPY
jgi:hypothetical protein